MKVTLNPGEMAIAQTMAAMRRGVNQASKITDQRRDNTMDANTLDLLGAVSEIAFCKAFSTYPDFSVMPRKGGADAILKHDGTITRWDIKATKRTGGRLLATTGKSANDVDYYALAVVQENVVDFVGYASAAELLSEETIIDLGHGPTHALTQDKLRRFKTKVEA